MVLIAEHEAHYFRKAAEWFKQDYLSEFYRALNHNLPSGLTRVGQLANLYDSVNLVIKQCTFKGPRFENVKRTGELDEALLPCLKRILIVKRRREATWADVHTEKTHNQLLIEEIEKDLRNVDSFLRLPWLDGVAPLKIPQISEFLSIERIQMQGQMHQLAEREYDEKFHILQAPRLMLKDLQYFREVCELRGVSLIVAYLDIDDFKAFNTQYGEIEIDRRVLPIFLRTIEAQLFQHGFGYRFGGDEYMLILPNFTRTLALSFLQSLRDAISALEFERIDNKMTVSIGFCCVDSDCALTDREIEKMANNAKSFAKSRGKNCIATYSSTRFQEEDLIIV